MNTNIVAILRFMLGLVFIFSGATKFWSLSSFSETLQIFSYLSDVIISFLLISIPAAEVILGSFLIGAYRLSLTSFTLLLMVFLFTVVTFQNYQNGQLMDCGCFGGFIERQNNWRLFVENTVLISLLAIVFIRQNSYTD